MGLASGAKPPAGIRRSRCLVAGIPKRDLIVTCAVTGASTTPSMAPYLTITRRRLFKSNAEQVEKIKRILDAFNIGVVGQEAVRRRLGLPAYKKAAKPKGTARTPARLAA